MFFGFGCQTVVWAHPLHDCGGEPVAGCYGVSSMEKGITRVSVTRRSGIWHYHTADLRIVWKTDELFSSYKLVERQKHADTGVHASVKLRYKVYSVTPSVTRISGMGAADTFQTLFTPQREKGPSLLPDTPWLRVWRTKLSPHQAVITDCCVETKQAEMDRDR